MHVQFRERSRCAQKTRTSVVHSKTEQLPRIDPIEFKAGVWQLCPHSIILERGGVAALRDGAGRPIIRVFEDESSEILSPDAEVFSIDRSPVFLHSDFGLPPGPQARKTIAQYIETYKLAPELRRRKELLRRGELTGGWGL